MLDNLIYDKRIPPIVAVLVAPGPGAQRSIEYDTVSDRYTNFVETELLSDCRLPIPQPVRIPRSIRATARIRIST